KTARNTVLTVLVADGVLANDRDADGDPLEAVLKTGPSHGRLDFFPDGSFTYSPDPGYQDEDSFTYVAHDPDGDSQPAKVTIKVGSPPEAQDHEYSTRLNRSLAVPEANGVLAGASDAESDFLTAVLKDAPEGQPFVRTDHGFVTLGENGSFTYTPDSGFSG